jgi:hypothetical protein
MARDTNSNPGGGMDFANSSGQNSSTNGEIDNAVFDSALAVVIGVRS